MFKLERYKLASLLLMFFAMTVLCTSLFLMIGVEVSFWNLVLALLVSGLLFFRMYGDSKATLIYTSTVIVVIGLLIMYSNVTFDNTWDGSAYHKQAIGFLKHGWNPIYQDNITFNELSNNIKYPRENPMVWAEAYPKAIWYFSASVYDLTGNIESGKLYHLLFAIITYLFFSEYLMSHKFKKYQYILISFVIACNPILMAQFNSYYLDSVVGCVLMLILLFFVQTFE
ncbi:MAG: hypothetical protein Q3993_04975, partial [Filifactor alocis]|nr:hypothetical protein [Filifactor alocis]